MTRHRYKLGETVDFRPARAGVPVPAASYEIKRLLPVEGRDLKYRIKCEDEPYERIAREHELSAVAS